MFVSVTKILFKYCKKTFFTYKCRTLKAVSRFIIIYLHIRHFIQQSWRSIKKIKFYDFLQGKCPMSSALPSQNFSSKQINPPFFFHAIFRQQNKAILFHIVERKLKSVTPPKGGPRSCLYITITCAFHRHRLTGF